ncbi:MAG: polyprenyl synthetase family protein [Flavobacteriales bacterium]|nr:polyprenyl synthetase family protein [Flavobacteriales bacterium]
MGAVDKIRRPIEKEMEVFEDKFRENMSSGVAMLDRVLYYLVGRKGKQMRPMFVFLTAKMIAGEDKPTLDSTYRAASLIELGHTASLVHDDVVDDSDKCRNFFSVNAIWKNKIAVLVGDFMLTRALTLAIDNEEFDMLRVVGHTAQSMAEGELLQIEKAKHLNITEEVYYEVIRGKTAVLISSCCAIGAISVGASKDMVELMSRFGLLCGMAFQIKDDLFDYTEDHIGKPTGIDIREQKMTLPLIYVLNTVSREERKWMINIVKKHNKDKKRVKELIKYVQEHGGLEYATAKMNEFKEQALDILKSFPESPARLSLEEMVRYCTERKL